MTTLRFPTFAFALVIAAAAGAAQALTLQQGSPAASQPGKDYASREQLRTCMAAEDELKSKSAVLDAAQAGHEKNVASIDAELVKLSSLQGKLDEGSDTAIRAFNAAVAEHNAHVKDVSQEGAALNKASASYTTEASALNKRCSGFVYLVDDMDAVMKERRASGK